MNRVHFCQSMSPLVWEPLVELKIFFSVVNRAVFRICSLENITASWKFRQAYGIKFIIIVQGRAGDGKNILRLSKTIQGKFDLKNVVINIVAGLGLLSFISMFCDFILLNYVNERFLVRQKKNTKSKSKEKNHLRKKRLGEARCEICVACLHNWWKWCSFLKIYK